VENVQQPQRENTHEKVKISSKVEWPLFKKMRKDFPAILQEYPGDGNGKEIGDISNCITKRAVIRKSGIN
jgi:hypothetical protein